MDSCRRCNFFTQLGPLLFPLSCFFFLSGDGRPWALVMPVPRLSLSPLPSPLPHRPLFFFCSMDSCRRCSFLSHAAWPTAFSFVLSCFFLLFLPFVFLLVFLPFQPRQVLFLSPLARSNLIISQETFDR
ncbi:hypothetical protein F4778DRAFT_416903 [Xylariomycetidae sp. FL2044]|nr:hypothetical protein F4778DRAFT_416903 [Xylariomycetidae sp. FL2044]